MNAKNVHICGYSSETTPQTFYYIHLHIFIMLLHVSQRHVSEKEANEKPKIAI